MPFPANVLQQAQYDAGVARRLDPNRNLFQQAQDFLRNKLSGGNTPNPSQRTPQQQVDFDAREGRRLMRESQKNKNVKSLQQLGGLVPALTSGGAILGLTQLGGSSDESTKWARLGYPSPEAYARAVAANSGNGSKGMADIRGTSGDNYKNDELRYAAAARPTDLSVDDAIDELDLPSEAPPLRPDEDTRTSRGVSQSGRQLGGMMSLGDATTLAGGYLADLGNYFPATAAGPSARTSGNVTGVVINGKRYENLSGDDLSEAQEAWLTSNPSDRETNFIYDSADQAKTVPIPGGPTNWMQPQGALARNASRAFLDAPRGGGAMGALRARDAQLGVVEGASGKKYAQINGQMVELGDGQYQSIIGRDADAIRGIIDAYPEGSVMPGGNVAPENVAISPAQTQQPAFGIAPAMPSPAANYQRLASGVQRAVQYGLTPEGSPNTAYSAEIFNRSMQMPAENFYDMLELPAEKEIPQEVFDSFDYRDLY